MFLAAFFFSIPGGATDSPSSQCLKLNHHLFLLNPSFISLPLGYQNHMLPKHPGFFPFPHFLDLVIYTSNLTGFSSYHLLTWLHLSISITNVFFKSLNFSPEFQLVFRGVSLPNQWFLYFTILKHFPGSCLKLEMPRSYLHQVLIW